MRRNEGVTAVEVFLLLAILVLAIALLLPALGNARRTARKFQNSTPVRGIHSGLVLYAQSNNGYYPGIHKDGVTIDPSAGLTVEGRIQKLIDENYFTAEYARSPSEAQTGTTSYALLQVNVNADVPDNQALPQTGRNREWRDTANTQAVVVADRAIDNGGSFAHIKSIHVKPSPGTTDWRGSVGWNDNHVTFESTHTLATKYGDVDHDQDHLFINQTGDAHTGSDAFMVHSGTSSL